MKPTPTLDKVINTLIDNKLSQIHTSIPAIIKSFDAKNKKISAQISLKRKLKDGILKEYPLLEDIPIAYFQSSNAIISIPLKINDPVILFFSERSLDIWKKTGGLIDPNDPRKHNLSDAFAMPAIFSFGNGLPAHSENLLIKYNDIEINLTPNNKISIGNNSQELLSIIYSLLQGLIDAKVNTYFGPQPLINAATFSSLKSNLGELKT